jgi:anti-anti-sigma regulatory factor
VQTITLPSKCDRAAASALVPDLSDTLGAQPLTVNAAQVERIGQAMLQLLVSAARTEGGIALTDPSEPFAAAVRLAGLEAILLEEASR